MSYLACNKNGTELIFAFKPKREGENWKPQSEESEYTQLPEGSIYKLLHRELTWEDEPVEI